MENKETNNNMMDMLRGSVSEMKISHNDSGNSWSDSNQWDWGDENEFTNREQYLEMSQLTDEQYSYNHPNIGSNQDGNDDEPLPPPGLRRLVTGQTVSFDEVSSSAFDRLIPGEGDMSDDCFLPSNNMRTVPGQHSDSDNQRLITGCVAEDRNIQRNNYQQGGSSVTPRRNSNHYPVVGTENIPQFTHNVLQYPDYHSNRYIPLSSSNESNRKANNCNIENSGNVKNFIPEQFQRNLNPVNKHNTDYLHNFLGNDNESLQKAVKKNVNQSVSNKPIFESITERSKEKLNSEENFNSANSEYDGSRNYNRSTEIFQYKYDNLYVDFGTDDIPIAPPNQFAANTDNYNSTSDNNVNNNLRIQNTDQNICRNSSNLPLETKNKENDIPRSLENYFRSPITESYNPYPQQQNWNQRMETEGASSTPIDQNAGSSDNSRLDERNNFRMVVEGCSETITPKNIAPSQNPSYDYWYSNNTQGTDNQWKLEFDTDFNSTSDALIAPTPDQFNSVTNERPVIKGYSDELPDTRQLSRSGMGDSKITANQRFNTVAQNEAFSSELSLTRPYSNLSSNSSVSSAAVGSSSKHSIASNDPYRYQEPAPTNIHPGIQNMSVHMNKYIEPEKGTQISRNLESIQHRNQNILHQLPDGESSNTDSIPSLRTDSSNKPRADIGFKSLAQPSVTSMRNDSSTKPRSEMNFQSLADSNKEFNEKKLIKKTSSERLIVPGAQSNDDEPNSHIFRSSTPTSVSEQRAFQPIDTVLRNKSNLVTENSNVSGHNPDATIKPPVPPGSTRLVRKMSKQFSVDNDDNPPEEFRRMVVGETGTNAPISISEDLPTHMNTERKQFERRESINEDHSRHISSKNNIKGKQHINQSKIEDRVNRLRKTEYEQKHRYMFESDEEDEENSISRRYDNSPDPELRSYHSKDGRYNSTRRNDMRGPRRDRNSSYTQSQDESCYDDDDYDTYKYHNSHYDRRPPRESRSRQNDSYYRNERRGYRERRRDMYNPRIDEDQYERGSRPSSRSDSDYRRDLQEYRHDHQEYPSRYYGRHPNEFGEPLYDRYIPGKFFDLQQPLNMKELFDFRQRDPKGYSAWYKWYTSARKCGASYVSGENINNSAMNINSINYQADRRGSGHASGQSSVSGDVINKTKESFDMSPGEKSYKIDEPIQEIRSTPAKFQMPHIKGVFNSLGQLIVVNPNSPQDGDVASIEISQLNPTNYDTGMKDFLMFPGPFIIGETHVNTVCEYLRYCAENRTDNSQKLLYLLIDLIIKLRGIIDGIAISELLMDNFLSSGGSLKSVFCTEDSFIESYGKLLLQGNKTAALNLAISNNEWHALSLAYKMDSKHASTPASKVDLKHFFAALNLLEDRVPSNSPLSTLYQLLSDHLPTAVECCADEKWGDWRPHLAMILSNATSNADLARDAVITLGDSLAARQNIHAAHFCYITAQLDLECAEKTSSRYTLLSVPNNTVRTNLFSLTDATIMTQAYEFAIRLQKKDFIISSLLPYKYLLAQCLTTYGRFNIAWQYLEEIASSILQNPYEYHWELVYHIVDLSERIKYKVSKPLHVDLSPDQEWLINLRQHLDVMKNNNAVNRPGSNLSHQALPTSMTDVSQQNPQPVRPSHLHLQSPLTEQRPYYQQTYQTQDNQSLYQQNSVDVQPPNMQLQNQYQNHDQNFQQNQLHQNQLHHNNQHNQLHQNQPQYHSNLQNVQNYQMQQPNINSNSYGLYLDENKTSSTEGIVDINVNTIDVINEPIENVPPIVDSYSNWERQPQQQISISTRSSYSYFDTPDVRDNRIPEEPSAGKIENPQITQQTNKELDILHDNKSNKEIKSDHGDNRGGGGVSGVFKGIGGFFGSKLSLRPKNQMKLPDDTKKTILWDEKNKKWINTDGDAKDESSMKPPPPKGFDPTNFTGNLQQPNIPSITPNSDGNSSAVLSTPSYNIPRGKGIKGRYVNVLAQSTTNSSQNQSSPMIMDPCLTSSSLHQLPVSSNLPSSSGSTGENQNASSHSLGPSPVNYNSQVLGSSQETTTFYNPNHYSTL